MKNNILATPCATEGSFALFSLTIFLFYHFFAVFFFILTRFPLSQVQHVMSNTSEHPLDGDEEGNIIKEG